MKLPGASLLAICGLGCVLLGLRSCVDLRCHPGPAAHPLASWSARCPAVQTGLGGPFVRGIGDIDRDGVGDLAAVLRPALDRQSPLCVHSGRDGSELARPDVQGRDVHDVWGLDLGPGARAVVVSCEGGLLALDTATWGVRWRRPDVRAYTGCVAGDLDGDGAEDLVTDDRGELRALSGRDGSDLWSRNLELQPVPGWASEVRPYAAAMCAGEDLDGDGVPDLVLALKARYPFRSSGGVWRVSGSGDAPPRLLALRPDDEAFGASLAWTDDRDADGRADVLASATGELLLVSTGGAGILRAWPTGALGAELDGVVDAGDVDGDGRRDHLLVASSSTPGRPLPTGSAFELRSGASARVLFTGGLRGCRWRGGGQVCGAGDLDGDGRGDLALLQPALTLRYVDFVPCDWVIEPRSRLEVLLAKDLLGAR